MKKTISLLLSLILVLSLFSCSGDTAAGKTDGNTETKINITDFAGKSYTLSSPPTDICCISPVAAEILYGLGISRTVKAIDSSVASVADNYTDTKQVTVDEGLAAHLKFLGISFFIYETDISGDIISSMEKEDIKTFKVASAGGISVAYSNIRLISSLMFKSDEGEKIIDSMRGNIELVKTMASNLSKRSTFYAETGTTEDIYALGTDTLISELIEIAGGDNIYEEKTGLFKTADITTVERNPEVMISFVTGEKFNVSAMRARDGYDVTDASKMGRIFVFDSTIPVRPAPSLIDALLEIAYLMDTMPRPVKTETTAA